MRANDVNNRRYFRKFSASQFAQTQVLHAVLVICFLFLIVRSLLLRSGATIMEDDYRTVSVELRGGLETILLTIIGISTNFL